MFATIILPIMADPSYPEHPEKLFVGGMPSIGKLGRTESRSEARGLWRVLLWGEWFSHGRFILFFLVAWVVLVWTLPLVAHPGWILALGLAYALLAGPLFGGTDVLEGSEEYVLSLPVPRRQRFAARAVMAGGGLVVLTLLDMLALGLDLSQMAARLYVEAGVIRPIQVNTPGLLYGLVLLLPLAVFSVSFGIASLASSRWLAMASSLWGMLAGLVLVWTGFHYEQHLWGRWNGWVACPLLTMGSVGALLWAMHAYRRKEISHCSPPVQLPVYWWVWILISVCAAVVGIALTSWFAGELSTLLRGR